MRRAAVMAVPARAALLASLARPPYHAVASWTDGARAVAATDAAVFVHYSADGQVSSATRALIAALGAAGLGVFVVSNSGHAALAADAGLRALCAGILVRRNVGYDFGAWREGLAHWQLPQPRTRMVLLANDSVLGPFAPLPPVLARLDFAAADIWGATDSPQRAYHLQSWFLAAGRAALDHPAWARFWDGVRPVRNKEWVVGHYEVALTRALLRAGLRVRALWPYAQLTRSLAPPDQRFDSLDALRQFARIRRFLDHGHALNPTADLWRQLLAAGCPFIKRELIDRNPARVADVADWQSVVGQRG